MYCLHEYIITALSSSALHMTDFFTPSRKQKLFLSLLNFLLVSFSFKYT